MRRLLLAAVAIVLTAGIAAAIWWAVARGDDGDGERLDLRACLATQQPTTALTLEEVAKRYNWFRFPSELPPGSTVTGLQARHLGPCVPSSLMVSATVSGTDYQIRYEVRNSTTPRDPDRTPYRETPRRAIVIDGVDGTVFDNGAGSIYSWEREGRSYFVYAEFGGALTHETLMRSLSTLGELDADALEDRCSVSEDTLLPTRTPAGRPVPPGAAGQLAGFDLLLPERFPAVTEMEKPIVTLSSACPERVYDVVVNYTGPGYTFGFLESRLGAPPRPEDAESIKIDGHEGFSVPRGENHVLIVWEQDGVAITAYASLGGLVDEEHFLEILESIPE